MKNGVVVIIASAIISFGNGNGTTFKIKIDDQAYEGHLNANESTNSIAGELSFEKIDLKDY